MDELDPYSDYTGYDPELTGKSETANSHSESEVEEEKNERPGALEFFDSRRFFEIIPSEPASSSYSSASRLRSGSIPLTAVSADTKRVSIHPLGIVEKPSGVSEASWSSLDRDRLLSPMVEIDGLAVELQGEESGAIHENKQQKTVQTGGAGGSGGRVDKADDEEKSDPTEMPFMDHLEEFRWALLKSIFAVAIGMVACWFVAEEFIGTMTRLAKNAEIELIYFKIMGTIMLRLQTALFMGIALSVPFVFYFLWSFISPGLYKREKKWILPVVFGATICFIIGAALAYFIIIPFMLSFLKGFMVPDVEGRFDIVDFISKMLKFTALFGVIFEMPMVTFVLAKIGVLKYKWMSRYRKYAIIFIFIGGAILTPPDPLSQIMMAIPLILLYEISIQVARIAGRKTLL